MSVIIATFGSMEWVDLAHKRAAPSVRRQSLTPVDIINITGDTLHEARNAGAEMAGGEWLCFLDADDELEQDYLANMAGAIDRAHDEAGIESALAYPKVRYCHPDGSCEPPRFPPRRETLRDMNWMVIGTLIRRDVFFRCGGFADWTAWEDWALWMRAVHFGAIPIPVDDAIYRAHMNPTGRNSQVRTPQRLMRQILRAHDTWVASL